MELGSLGEELVGEILDRIPIKQVIRMKCLSKSWFCLITRYRDSKPRVSSSTFILQYGTAGHPSLHQILFLQAKEQPQRRGNVLEKLLGYSGHRLHFNFLGSSNGLILFNQFVEPDKVIAYVCNPAAKQWQWDTLPPFFHPKNRLQIIYIRMGLAFDGVPGHPYKVISYTEISSHGDLEFQIYSSDTQEWRKHIQRIPHPSLLLGQFSLFSEALNIDTPHLFWKGMLLYIAKPDGYYSYDNLLVHHIENNSFKLMRLPKRGEDYGSGGLLWESQGYLHYCQNVVDGFCVWKYVDYNSSWETFIDMDSAFGKWKLVHTANNIVTLVYQNLEAYGSIGYLSLFQPCAFDEGLQIVYILLPRSIISYSFENRRLSKVWTFEQSIKMPCIAPRTLSCQINGTNCPIGGDSIWSLTTAEPQWPPIMR